MCGGVAALMKYLRVWFHKKQNKTAKKKKKKKLHTRKITTVTYWVRATEFGAFFEPSGTTRWFLIFASTLPKL
jgi:hypothetical protein